MPSGGTISSAPLPPIASTPAPPERSDWWPAASFDTFKRSSSPWAGGSPASTLLIKHTCTRTHRQLRLHLALQRESGGLAPAPPAPAPPAPPRPLHHLVFLFSECSYFPVGSAGLTPETGSVLCPATRSGARLSEPVRQLSDVSVPTSASSKALLVTGRTGPIPVQAARGRKGEGTWREAQSAPATHDCLPLSGSRLRCLGCQGRGERGRGARGCHSPPRDPTADSRPHVHLLLLRVSYLRAPDRWVPKPQSLTPPPLLPLCLCLLSPPALRLMPPQRWRQPLMGDRLRISAGLPCRWWVGRRTAWGCRKRVRTGGFAREAARNIGSATRARPQATFRPPPGDGMAQAESGDSGFRQKVPEKSTCHPQWEGTQQIHLDPTRASRETLVQGHPGQSGNPRPALSRRLSRP